MNKLILLGDCKMHGNHQRKRRTDGQMKEILIDEGTSWKAIRTIIQQTKQTEIFVGN